MEMIRKVKQRKEKQRNGKKRKEYKQSNNENEITKHETCRKRDEKGIIET